MREAPKRLHLCYGSVIAAQDIGEVTVRGSKTGILLRLITYVGLTFHLIKVARRWLATNAGCWDQRCRYKGIWISFLRLLVVIFETMVEAQSGTFWVHIPAIPFHSGNAAVQTDPR